uniref:Uncharacterized protein n=1 Tax=Lygus hesperus TaxID=30085 RepID=A0A0A9X0B8_LYGHE
MDCSMNDNANTGRREMERQPSARASMAGALLRSNAHHNLNLSSPSHIKGNTSNTGNNTIGIDCNSGSSSSHNTNTNSSVFVAKSNPDKTFKQATRLSSSQPPCLLSVEQLAQVRSDLQVRVKMPSKSVSTTAAASHVS